MPISLEHADCISRLFEQYYERVYRFSAQRIPGEDAEDVTQEVYMRLLCMGDLPRRSINASYLIKIADNLIRNRYRKRQRFDRWYREHGRPEAARRLDAPRGQPVNTGLWQLIDTLPPRERDALDLVTHRSLSYRQAARSMGIPVSTLNNLKHRAITRLRGGRTGPESGEGPTLN